MRFLEDNESRQWCIEQNIGIDEHGNIRPYPQFSHHARADYGSSGRSGREPILAVASARELGRWEECLLWVKLWGIWGSSEDWPSYYALRGIQGERRSLEKAPGHLFFSNEMEELTTFLTVVMENGWDAHVLTAAKATLLSPRAFISHDGWVELFSSSMITFSSDMGKEENGGL